MRPFLRTFPAACRTLTPLTIILALPAGATAQIAERLDFRAGPDQVSFVATAGEVAARDGVYTQSVTVRLTANDGRIRGAIQNAAVHTLDPSLLAFAPALLFLDLTGLASAENQGERFGLVIELPPGPVRVDLAAFAQENAVRTMVGPYALAAVAAGKRAIGQTPPPTNEQPPPTNEQPPPNPDRTLRGLLIRTGTLPFVPGSSGERPVVVNAIPPPTNDTPPPVPDSQLVLAVTAPAGAFASGPARFTAELVDPRDPGGPGTVFQGTTSEQPPPTHDLPPGPVRQFLSVELPQGLPPGPVRLVLSLRFADGTIGVGAVTVESPPPVND